MKKAGWLHRIVFWVNTLFALLLLCSYALPYVFPKSFPSLSVLSLGVPVLIIVNVLFMIYWILWWKRAFFLSFIILLIGIQYVSSFYRFGGQTEEATTNAISVMSYNVRIFNKYEWIPRKGVDSLILSLIRKENPDVLCIQEFHSEKEDMFSHYPYRYIRYKSRNQQTGQAIFSRYPISSRGSLEFPETGNNAIYADLVSGKDTVRVYNLHLESLHINPEQEVTSEESGRLFRRMGKSFGLQQTQAEIFSKHRERCNYAKIVCGDFNNTQFSNIYKQVRGDMKDSFEEAGSGFGKTFNFRYFPMRIDFILADPEMEIVLHKNYREAYSDHFPVFAKISLSH